jgi:hypothetical protein
MPHVTNLTQRREAQSVAAKIRGEHVEAREVQFLCQPAIATTVLAHAVGNQHVSPSFPRFVAKPLTAENTMALSGQIQFVARIFQDCISVVLCDRKYSLTGVAKTNWLFKSRILGVP